MHNDSNQFLAEEQQIQSKYFDEDAPSKQKLAYFQQIRTKNREMTDTIKKINKFLDSQVKKLRKPAYEKKERKPIFEKKDSEIQMMYEKLEKLKRASKKQESQRVYKLDLQQRIFQMENQIRTMDEQIKASYKKYKTLKGELAELKQNQKQDFNMHDSFVPEISQLKDQIKKQMQRINNQQKQFIQKNKHNSQQNKTYQKSTRNISADVINTVKEQQMDNQTKILKETYQNMGKRIQLLKIRKHALSSKSEVQDKLNLLKTYKQKYEELSKLAKK